MTDSIRTQFAVSVCSLAPAFPRQAPYAVAEPVFSTPQGRHASASWTGLAGLAGLSVKRTGMAGIDANGWPLGPEERLSG